MVDEIGYYRPYYSCPPLMCFRFGSIVAWRRGIGKQSYIISACCSAYSILYHSQYPPQKQPTLFQLQLPKPTQKKYLPSNPVPTPQTHPIKSSPPPTPPSSTSPLPNTKTPPPPSPPQKPAPPTIPPPPQSTPPPPAPPSTSRPPAPQTQTPPYSPPSPPPRLPNY